MSTQPITLHSWPSAILHIDADAFFASCEQAVRPELRGKPVITGKERGIVSAASYEAKGRGVERGDVAVRKVELFKGENKRQRLGLPVLDVKV